MMLVNILLKYGDVGGKEGGSDRCNFIGYGIANQHETGRRLNERLEIGEVNVAAMRDQTPLYGRIRARDRVERARRRDRKQVRHQLTAPQLCPRAVPSYRRVGKVLPAERALPLLYNMGGLVRRFIERWLATERDLFASGVRGRTDKAFFKAAAPPISQRTFERSCPGPNDRSITSRYGRELDRRGRRCREQLLHLLVAEATNGNGNSLLARGCRGTIRCDLDLALTCAHTSEFLPGIGDAVSRELAIKSDARPP